MRHQASDSPSGAKPRRWPLLIPMAIGMAFVALAAVSAAPDLRFALAATRTEGRFVGAVKQTHGSGGSVYRPMFRYRTADGSIRTFTARSGSTRPIYAEGDTATVLYDPAHPGDARLSGFFELWGGPAVLAGCGLFLILFGVSLQAALKRREAGH